MVEKSVIRELPIPGLLKVDIKVHSDKRGWFKEAWNKREMDLAGIPDFIPVQNNVSQNEARGVARGFHAEPWDKLVSINSGRAFGAWLDLRAGDTFGKIHFEELTLDSAIFVPRGVANAYQVLEPGTVYSYLVNGYWTEDAKYLYVSLLDPDLSVPWPIPITECLMSAKDENAPRFRETSPVPRSENVILGASGQIGKSLMELWPHSLGLTKDSANLLNVSDLQKVIPIGGTIVNCAAFTKVDACETEENAKVAWEINAASLVNLTEIARDRGCTLVHISSDYVFSGNGDRPYFENDIPNPINVYGATKAAGDFIVMSYPKAYIFRTSWVVGSGDNFVRKIASKAKQGEQVRVVTDEKGRLTFASELARGIDYVLRSKSPYGVYNLTNSGQSLSRYEIAVKIYELMGVDTAKVVPSSGPYSELSARRPKNSELSTSKLNSIGFFPRDQVEALSQYLFDEGFINER